MSKLSINNFLWGVRQLVMGGGVQDDGTTPLLDGGYLHDVPYSLNDLNLTFSDSTGGTASSSLAAGAGVFTLAFPIQLAAMTTAAADLMTNYTPGYAFKILAVDFVTTQLGTGSGASQVLNLEIGTTNVTGGVVTVTLASTDTLGEITAGTAVTAANTGTAADTLSVEVAAGGTVFTAGAGILYIKIQNMDTANAISSLAAATATASETNLRVASSPAGTTAIGSVNFVVPRDYDEATDTLQLRIGIASAGSTDAPAITAAAYRKRPGSSIATITASVTGKTASGGTLTMSTTEQLMVFNLSRAGLRRNDAVTILLTSAAHTTDALLIYYVQPVYRSTLVSYKETDGTTNRTGNLLR